MTQFENARNAVALPISRRLSGVWAAAMLTVAAGCWQTEPVEVVRAPSAEELSAACDGDLTAVKDELSTAQARVAELEREAATKQGRVQELEGRIAKGGEAGRAIREELAAVKAELAEVKEKLVVAEREKEELLVQLTQTQEQLAQTKVELAKTAEQRDEAREDALFNRWQKFVATSQLEICDKGNRKKLGGCREAVQAALESDPRRDAFAHCIRSGQAQPVVHELEKDAALPSYAEMMNEEAKQVKGWYVEYCDPTLPEKVDAPLAESHVPPTTPPQG